MLTTTPQTAPDIGHNGGCVEIATVKWPTVSPPAGEDMNKT